MLTLNSWPWYRLYKVDAATPDVGVIQERARQDILCLLYSRQVGSILHFPLRIFQASVPFQIMGNLRWA